MDIVVTYDIATTDRAGQRRLTRVAATCERYGTRVQYSVFECRLTEVLFEKLQSELLDIIKLEEDSVCFYRLGHSFATSRQMVGTKRPSWEKPMVI